MAPFEIIPLIITLCSGVISSVTGRIRLSAVSDIPYFEHLYQKLQNKDPPSTLDPGTYSASIRRRICADITGSGFFEWYAMDPISGHEMYDKLLNQSEYASIARQIYDRPSKSVPYRYANRYTLQKFKVRSLANKTLYETEDYVFICCLKRRSSDELVPYYVSKEYNVSAESALGTYKAGRFVFGEERFVILAEESGEAYAEPNFNVEFEYIRRKRDHRPEVSFEDDPVRKLISKEARENQHFRLCAIVLSSPYFGSRFKYPTRVNAYAIIEDDISFRTPEASNEATGNEFREQIVVCPVRVRDSPEQTRVYISRAFRTGEVFVYLRDPSDGRLYLENLTTNVGIVYEPFSHRLNFDDVE